MNFHFVVRLVPLCFMLLLCLGLPAVEPELCVAPDAPLPEMFKAAEAAVARLEQLPPKTFIKANLSDGTKANAAKDIVYLDEQLLNYIVLQMIRQPEALELKWRQFSSGRREKRILILLCHWNYLPEDLDALQPEGSIQYCDLSAWDPASKEYRERREEIEFIRQNGRALHDRIQAMTRRGYEDNRQWFLWLLGGSAVWWFACAIIHPRLRKKEDGRNFPTTASVTVRWLGILVPLAATTACLIGALF